ncbi:Gfo/Idh/MocA family protein [uncultured Pseudokineococcus sp.]|uniref:Gfo/Idh/MocA family protein n=1 Tax=uncultured Pseudokineococcus sp. TaxID=1642928 RepID=UPI002632DCED|nr:Gfo/Idh/MocA family oxidoreductase [uncultured Pseudokineococcus sp.]
MLTPSAPVGDDPRQTASPVRVGVVGSGFRAGLFVDLARRLPGRFAVVGVVSRSAQRRDEVAARWSVPVLSSTAELAGERPDVVLTALPWGANPVVVEELVERGLPVLSETPPARDAAGLRELWSRVGGSGLVQVAEQYGLQPMSAARSAVLRAGHIGRVTSAQVSMTQLYHAVSLLRGALGAGCGPTEVRATSTESLLADPLSRAGWADQVQVRPVTTTHATIDFGTGAGLYDFTETQTRNPLRSTRVVVRGERGEVVDERVVRLLGPATVVESRLVRRQTGAHADFEVLDLDHVSFDGEVVYRNPFPGARLSDEEIAMASALEATGAWAREGGPAPYPLAEACQDHLLGLAITAAAESGRPVTTDVEPWAAGEAG